MLVRSMEQRLRAWGYRDQAEMAWASAHQCMVVACVAAAPMIGNMPALMVAGVLAALGMFFFFSEGVRRAAWRRQMFPEDPRPPCGTAAVGAMVALAPAFAIIAGAWTAYGLMSWHVLGALALGIAYMACAITAAEAVVAEMRAWYPWMFSVLCLAFQPMFLFGPLFRPDMAIAPELYRLSLWNPAVPGIEAVRAGLFDAPMQGIGALYAWAAVFIGVIVWCGARDRRRRGRHRH